jgi:hypothetical protein
MDFCSANRLDGQAFQHLRDPLKYLDRAADWIGAGTRVVVTAGGQDLRSASTWICGLDEFLAGLPVLLG